jgi:diguanylate cyclase (GGDEF)-like protein
MSNTAIAIRSTGQTSSAKLLWAAMGTVVCAHALVLLVAHPAPVGLSRGMTAAVPMLAGVACVWRARRLLSRERPVWLWTSAGLFLWALAHVVETVVGHSPAASSLTVDGSDFIYMAATFPLLLALSTTRETESLRAVLALNLAQIALALVLTYALLFRMSMSPQAAATAMGRIYGAACVLLALMGLLRMFAWASGEERQVVRLICVVLWTYLPIEVGMDYATARWNLHAGTIFDLLWSAPFFLAGWQALHLPILQPELEPRDTTPRGRLLVEALCPMLITAGIFTLAASITPQHPMLGLTAIFALLAIRGIQSAVVQLNYLSGRSLLLQREHDLEEANARLRQMSEEDPLTGIANRRRFEEALGRSWRRGARREQPMALLMLDIDFFKGVNDHHGHSYGDECLVAIARLMREHARRPDDIVARLGGEEFVLLLPDTESRGAASIARRMQESVEALGVTNKASPFDQKLTVSIGVGSVNQPRSGVDPTMLVDCADQALYDAKHQGRNRTCTRTLD